MWPARLISAPRENAKGKMEVKVKWDDEGWAPGWVNVADIVFAAGTAEGGAGAAAR
jgi:hypothetical protein